MRLIRTAVSGTRLHSDGRFVLTAAPPSRPRIEALATAGVAHRSAPPRLEARRRSTGWDTRRYRRGVPSLPQRPLDRRFGAARRALVACVAPCIECGRANPQKGSAPRLPTAFRRATLTRDFRCCTPSERVGRAPQSDCEGTRRRRAPGRAPRRARGRGKCCGAHAFGQSRLEPGALSTEVVTPSADPGD